MAKKKVKDDGVFISFVDEPASEQVTGSMIYIKTSFNKRPICYNIFIKYTHDNTILGTI